MPETFHGPWELVAQYVNSHFLQSLVIRGSEGVDERYHLNNGSDVWQLTVDGAEWELTAEWFPFGGEEEYQPCQVRRTTQWLPDAGLVVLLEGATRGSSTLAKDYDNLRVLCRCLDESINPPQRPNPFDFTYPDG
jgi:hypothetical protein